MGRLLFLAAGAIAGIALAENKEFVGQVCVSAAEMTKSAAINLQDFEVQGTKLSEVPLLGFLLRKVSTMDVNVDFIQQGVNAASEGGKMVVRQASATKYSASTAPTSEGSSSWMYSLFKTSVFCIIPVGGAYIAYDKNARKKTIVIAKSAGKNLQIGVELLKNDAIHVKDLIVKQTPLLYNKVQIQLVKSSASTTEYLKQQYQVSKKLAETHIPKIYHEMRTKADLFYIKVRTEVEKLASRSQNLLRNSHVADKDLKKGGI